MKYSLIKAVVRILRLQYQFNKAKSEKERADILVEINDRLETLEIFLEL